MRLQDALTGRAIAAVVIVAGVLVFSVFDGRGPVLTPPWTPRDWTQEPLDAGVIAVQFSEGQFDFIRAQDPDQPERSFAVIRHGKDYLRIDDLNAFFAVAPNGKELWVASRDDGSAKKSGAPKRRALFGVRLGQGSKLELCEVPLPAAEASFSRLRARDGAISLELELAQSTELAAAYLEGGEKRMIGPGAVSVVSRSDGRSWFLRVK